MTRTVRTSDEPVQSCENSKLGPPLDRRTFLIGAGVAAGQGFPVSTMAQSTAATSSVFRRIDAYSHFSSLKFLDFAERQADRPFVLRPMYERLTTLTDWRERIGLLDKNEIDVHVLVPVPWLEAFPKIANDPMLASQAARMMNDELAAFVAQQPKRFRGVAALPTASSDATVAELHRAVKELGFLGGFIAVGPTAKRTDHPDMEALYKALVELDATLWLHPSRPPMPDYVDEKVSKFEDWITFGWLHDTTSAMARIAFSGVFDRYPDIRIVAHHHGALLPTYAKRFDSLLALGELSGDVLATKIARPYIDHFKKFYCDTAAFGYEPKVLEIALNFFGPERVLFGTDTPFDSSGGQYFTAETLRSIQDMAVSGDVRTALLSGNAIKALKLV
jgi:predicted TIM-barrel fold metal-dependent hydrolase